MAPTRFYPLTTNIIGHGSQRIDSAVGISRNRLCCLRLYTMCWPTPLAPAWLGHTFQKRNLSFSPSLTGKLVSVQLQYLQLPETSECLGNVTCTAKQEMSREQATRSTKAEYFNEMKWPATLRVSLHILAAQADHVGHISMKTESLCFQIYDWEGSPLNSRGDEAYCNRIHAGMRPSGETNNVLNDIRARNTCRFQDICGRKNRIRCTNL